MPEALDVKTGDRVRISRDPAQPKGMHASDTRERIVLDGVARVQKVGLDLGTYGDVELLEVAWYAPPGVTMVAMTSEDVGSFAAVFDALRHEEQVKALQNAMPVMYRMLAEARGDVKHG